MNERWTPEKLHPIVRKVYEAGFQFDIPIGGRPTFHEPQKPSQEVKGFNSRRMSEDADEGDRSDKEMISCLDWGAIDFSSSTPPVCIFVGTHPNARQHASTFDDQLKGEVQKGWQSAVLPRPTRLDFQICSGNLVLKRCMIKWRLTWNASSPRPQRKEGMIQENGISFPILSNFNTVLNEAVRFGWTSQHSNDEAISIVATADIAINEELVGTTRDMDTWFSRSAMVTPELSR